jgi:murein DD-endopeptidase MepM/ murein hydrolase activator NlpD
MLEWVLGVGLFGWMSYAILKEKKRPQRRQIHCHIEFVDHGKYLDLMVHNEYGVEITASFEWQRLENVRWEGDLPQISVIPGAQAVPVVRLWKTSPKPLYSVDWKWVWGSVAASHDPDAVYALPYEPGTRYSVAQGPGGTFTHFGESFHAVDFDMPIGTPVLAARAGLVVDTEGDFRAVGLSTEAGGNYVLVQHDDDTVAEYFHLKTDGIKVLPGMQVEVGDLLGYSGNTGCSGGPHLHLMVFRAVDGTKRESLPMLFRVAGSSHSISLETNNTYEAC